MKGAAGKLKWKPEFLDPSPKVRYRSSMANSIDWSYRDAGVEVLRAGQQRTYTQLRAGHLQVLSVRNKANRSGCLFMVNENRDRAFLLGGTKKHLGGSEIHRFMRIWVQTLCQYHDPLLYYLYLIGLH